MTFYWSSLGLCSDGSHTHTQAKRLFCTCEMTRKGPEHCVAPMPHRKGHAQECAPETNSRDDCALCTPFGPHAVMHWPCGLCPMVCPGTLAYQVALPQPTARFPLHLPPAPWRGAGTCRMPLHQIFEMPQAHLQTAQGTRFGGFGGVCGLPPGGVRDPGWMGVQQSPLLRGYREGGRLGIGRIWNGKIWHNKSVPTFAVVFEGPKPFF